MQHRFQLGALQRAVSVSSKIAQRWRHSLGRIIKKIIIKMHTHTILTPKKYTHQAACPWCRVACCDPVGLRRVPPGAFQDCLLSWVVLREVAVSLAPTAWHLCGGCPGCQRWWRGKISEQTLAWGADTRVSCAMRTWLCGWALRFCGQVGHLTGCIM